MTMNEEGSNPHKKYITRPLAVIDWDLVKRFLRSGCSGTEIAAYIGISKNVIYERCQQDHEIQFSEYAQMHKRSGNAMIRNKQFELAMEGDRVMLIWLGRQRLGQRDNPGIEEEMPQVLKDFIETMKASFSGKLPSLIRKDEELHETSE